MILNGAKHFIYSSQTASTWSKPVFLARCIFSQVLWTFFNNFPEIAGIHCFIYLIIVLFTFKNLYMMMTKNYYRSEWRRFEVNSILNEFIFFLAFSFHVLSYKENIIGMFCPIGPKWCSKFIIKRTYNTFLTR